MMQTYLDYYAQGLAAKLAMARKFQLANKENSPEDFEFLKKACQSDGYALSFIAQVAQKLLTSPDLADEFKGLTEEMIETNYFQARLLPFFQHGPKAPLALQLSKETVAALAAADASKDIRDHSFGILDEHKCVYIDIPNKDYRLRDDLSLRAILADVGGIRIETSAADDPGTFDTVVNDQGFVMRHRRPDNKVVFTAIFQDRKNNIYPRLSWVEGSDFFMGRGIKQLGIALATPKVMLANADMLTKHIMTDIENLFWLSLAFMDTEEEIGGVQYPQLPHLAYDHVRRQGRKAGQVGKKFSMFRVKKITGGRDLGRDVETQSEGRTSGLPVIGRRRHEVRGHFRLQRFGKGYKLTRLRWINAFERGSIDDLPLHDLHIVTATEIQPFGQ
ncbi:hypothetical protein [Brucella tritici]|uniref:Uncharacterized protein n=1 Tax=Brucella tritici TaxID=94626 RepID=A0A6L3YAZ9_9HYPH|nr:hypothetical protein [Brucella tritici]KAB2680028.1 hypothetical protein F9L08_21765 [Brucella tritici]